MTFTNENFQLIAMKHYDNCQLNTIEEFQSDLNRIMCAEKIIERYLNSSTKMMNIRLLMNHCIVLHNAFGKIVGPMFKFKFPPHFQAVIRPVLEYLKIIRPNEWKEVDFDDDVRLMIIQVVER